jgi:hypothetical protein
LLRVPLHDARRLARKFEIEPLIFPLLQDAAKLYLASNNDYTVPLLLSSSLLNHPRLPEDLLSLSSRSTSPITFSKEADLHGTTSLPSVSPQGLNLSERCDFENQSFQSFFDNEATGLPFDTATCYVRGPCFIPLLKFNSCLGEQVSGVQQPHN